MTKKYQNIFFDLDGTISDSYPGIENGIRFALKKAGINEIDSSEIRNIIGKPLSESLKKYCQNDIEKTTEAVTFFREYYSNKGIIESKLYPEIEQLLSWASCHYKLYVITAKPTVYAIKLLELQNVANYFTEIKGCELSCNDFKKSNLMRSVNNHEKSIIIGDKKDDIDAGKELGIKTCAVSYGYGTHEEIIDSNPDFIAHSVNDVKQILNFNNE